MSHYYVIADVPTADELKLRWHTDSHNYIVHGKVPADGRQRLWRVSAHWKVERYTRGPRGLAMGTLPRRVPLALLYLRGTLVGKAKFPEDASFHDVLPQIKLMLQAIWSEHVLSGRRQ